MLAGTGFNPGNDNAQLEEKYNRSAASRSMKMPKKTNPQQEYRLKQRERIEASPLITKQFPRLKALTVKLEFFNAAGNIKQTEMKWKLNMEHARSALWFACPGVDCTCGDFDASDALAKAVAARRNVATGDLRCPGTRKRPDRQQVLCGTLLRYKIDLVYD